MPHPPLDADEFLYVNSGMEALEGLPPQKMEIPGTSYTLLLEVIYFLHFCLSRVKEIFMSLAQKEILHLVSLLDAYFIEFYRDPSVQYFLGRSASALFGTLSVWLTYRMGREFYGVAAGLGAASLLFLCPFYVRFSHAAVSYPMAGFLYLAALQTTVRIIKENSPQRYMWAGGWIGLCLAARINAISLLAGLLAAHFLGRNAGSVSSKASQKNLAFSFLCAFLAFYAVCPYVVTAGFLFPKELFLRVFYPGRDISFFTEMGSTLAVLRRELGGLLCLLGIAAAASASMKRDRVAILLSCVLAAELLLVARAGLLYERYVFFSGLLIILLTGFFAGAFLSSPRPTLRWGSRLLLAVCVVSHLHGTAGYLMSLRKENTRILALRWVESNVPDKAVVFQPKDLLYLRETREHLLKKLDLISGPFSYREKFQVQAGQGKPLAGLFSQVGGYPFTVFSDMMLHEEKHLARELAFRLADPLSRSPSYEVHWVSESTLFLMDSRSEARARYRNGEGSVFIDTQLHPEFGRPKASFMPGRSAEGPPIYIYIRE